MSVPYSRSASSSLQGRRDSNQDAVLDVRLPDGRHLVALADGMGGHRGGEVASAAALEALRREICAGRGLREAVVAANAAVHELAAGDPVYRGMGTTLVALLRAGAAYEIANVGDSRAYRVDRRGIGQITVDHSFAAEALRAAFRPEEIARSPWRNALTRSLGTHPELEVDLFGPFEVPGPPHVVVLCSDGFYRCVSETTLRERLLHGGTLDSAVSALARLALTNGSDDNVSLAVVEMGPLPAPASSLAPTAGDRAPERRALRAAPAPPSAPVAPLPAAAALAAPRTPPVRLPRRARHMLALLASESFLFTLCACLLVTWVVMALLQG